MVEEIVLRGYEKDTQESYVRSMVRLCRFAGKTPARIEIEDIREFLVHLSVEEELAPNSVKLYRHGIRFYFREVEGRPEVVAPLPPMKSGTILPEPLSVEQVVRLLQSTRRVRDAFLLVVAYGCGLRVSELVSVQISHLQSDRMMLFVKGGKGSKDRYVPFSQAVLDECRLYFQMCQGWNRGGKESPWLFPSPRDRQRHLTEDTAQRAFQKAKERAGILGGKGIHTLRHSYATHLLEAGVDIRTLQEWMGHKHLKSTLPYLHVSRIPPARLCSPYDLVKEKLDEGRRGIEPRDWS